MKKHNIKYTIIDGSVHFSLNDIAAMFSKELTIRKKEFIEKIVLLSARKQMSGNFMFSQILRTLPNLESHDFFIHWVSCMSLKQFLPKEYATNQACKDFFVCSDNTERIGSQKSYFSRKVVFVPASEKITVIEVVDFWEFHNEL